MYGRVKRDEETGRGNISRRKREKGGGNGYFGDIKERKRDREMVIRGYKSCHRGKG